MVRLLVTIAVLFAFAIGFSWLADQPGTITITWLNREVDVDPVVAVIALIVFFVVLMIIWTILRVTIKSPESLRRFFGRRHRDKGYEALSSALIALGSGDSVAAKRYAKDARKHLKGAPVTQFLEAQVAQQEDRANDARAIFENLTVENRTRLLGLHGLFLEARHQGEDAAARHYAEQAFEKAPHLPWAGQALFDMQCAERDWEAAMKTLEQNQHAKLIDRKVARRKRAVLLTALAQTLEDGDPDRARKLAVEAHGLAPELVPAAVIASRLLARYGDIRKAAKILEAAWKKDPHPDLADCYAYVRPGDSVQDRLKRVENFSKLRPNSPQGAMALARVAIDASAWSIARDALKKVVRSNPTQQAFILMSELEEGEHGDRGRVREWLGRAVRAPRDPVWTADGVVSDEWAPISPVTGRLDAFEWKVPLEDLDDQPGAMIEDSLLESLPPPRVISPEETDKVIDVDTRAAAGMQTTEAAAQETSIAAATAQDADGKTGSDEATAASAPQPDASDADPAKPEPVAANDDSKAAGSQAEEAPAEPQDEANKANGKDPRPVEFPLSGRPDDPGTDQKKPEPAEAKRFSLFS